MDILSERSKWGEIELRIRTVGRDMAVMVVVRRLAIVGG